MFSEHFTNVPIKLFKKCISEYSLNVQNILICFKKNIGYANGMKQFWDIM